MEYEELSDTQKATIDKYLDLKDIHRSAKEIKDLIELGRGITELANYYATEVHDLGLGCYFIDVNIGKYDFSIFEDEDGVWLGDVLSVWDDNRNKEMFRFSVLHSEFWCVRELQTTEEPMV